MKIERIAWTTVFLTAALALLCVVTGVGDAKSVAFGGAVSWLNLRLIRTVVSRLMSPVATGGLSSVVAIKFLLLLALLAVALQRLPIDAASFLLGGGTLFVAIVLEAVLLGEPLETPQGEDGNP
ncbi:MAG: ATP synthase subunit I [Candidatus Binatia bacterium]